MRYKTNKNVEIRVHLKELGFNTYKEVAIAAGISEALVQEVIFVGPSKRFVLTKAAQAMATVGVDISMLGYEVFEKLDELMFDYPQEGYDFYEEIYANERREIVELVISTLTDRKAAIVKAYYFEGGTYESLGRKYNVTRERIRQILTKAREQMEHPTRARKLLSVY